MSLNETFHPPLRSRQWRNTAAAERDLHQHGLCNMSGVWMIRPRSARGGYGLAAVCRSRS